MRPIPSLRRFSILLLLLVGALLITPSLLRAAEPTAPPRQEPSPPFDLAQVPAPDVQPSARAGRGLFAENCAACHGETGRGDGPTAASLPDPPTAFADPNAVWERSPAELFHTAKFGRIEKLMPPWSNQLTDGQIWNAVAYAWGLHTDQLSVETGALLYGSVCAACHGAAGAGDGPDGAEVLSDFTDTRYAMAVSQAGWLAGWQSAHPEEGAEYSQDQQRNILEYVRTFSYTPAWASAYRPGVGVISGQVLQGSADGAAVDGMQVVLEGFVDFEPVVAFTTTTGTDGSFSFAHLGTDPTTVYFASASLEGISYSSPILMFGEGQGSLETTVNVYAPTSDDSAIRAERAHWIVDSQPGALVIGQIYAFGNTGDRAFVGKQVAGVEPPVTAAITVPPGAVEISFENGQLGGRFQQVGHTIYDTAPIVPGSATRQIVVRFALPFDGTSVEFEQSLLYPAQSLNLLVSELPGMSVTVTGLAELGPQDIQGEVYQMWQAENVAPTQKIGVRITGLLAAGDIDPRGESGQTSASSPRVPQLAAWNSWALAGVLVLGLAAALAWAWRTRMTQPGDEKGLMRRQRTELIQRIAKLDDLHAVGELNDANWQQQRARLKAELLTVASKLTEA
ncbi:MAG: c-type cytochrome [Caldilineaceae bacterium]|nr:c-type cytochrome [Caldilineaceae bacterium]